MGFSDLLKKPLPSKMKEEVTTESSEEKEIEEVEVEEVTDNVEEEVAEEETETVEDTVEDTVNENGEMDDVTKEMDSEIKKLDMTTEDSDDDENIEDVEDPSDDVDDLDDIDLGSLSDEELEELEADLRDSDLDDVTDDIDPVELTADEEREADDLMSLAGTTELLKSELNVEERAAFLESTTETQIAVFEGFLLESDVVTITESSDETSEEDVMTEAKMYHKTSVRFSAEDRKAQLYAVAINVSARAHNDPDFIKLQRVQKMRRVLKRKLQKKYHAEAVKRMKVYFNRLKSSRSSVLAAIGKKIDK